MGERVSMTLRYAEESLCEFCHMEKPSGEDSNMCCDDENQFVKVHADQDLAVSIASPTAAILFLNDSLHNFHNALLQHTEDRAHTDFTVPTNISAQPA